MVRKQSEEPGAQHGFGVHGKGSFQRQTAHQASAGSGDKSVTAEESDEESTEKPPATGLHVEDLALTKDATDVEYNSLVEHVLFKSKSNVKKVCAELAANLKAQGWINDGFDLVQPQSWILRREHGDAALTIFVKPADGGSEVKMFTEGPTWDGQ